MFSVGEQEIHDFTMVERHYFRNRLIKSYDFDFPFCIPGTTNTFQAAYDVPPLEKDLSECSLQCATNLMLDGTAIVADSPVALDSY